MKDLKTCREEIDLIDQQMIELFEKRMNVAEDVITYKLAHDMPIFQSDREQQVLEKNVMRIQNEKLKDYARVYVQDVMNISKTYQSSFIPSSHIYPLKEPHFDQAIVGFQGVQGSFSEHALETFFHENIKRKNYYHFEDVFKALQNDEIDYGVVPLENSSTGAINDNYDLIRDYGFYIIGEQSLSISQHLLGIKGATLNDITDVYSHPQGILQCSLFLSQNPSMIPHEYANTATAAKYVSHQKDIHLGAIASSKAASVYDLEILKENIQDNKTNSTRFIIFSKSLEKVKDATCVSIVFTVKHQVGALYQVMKIINDHMINMLRIESRPLKDTPWEYYFYVDFEGNLENESIVSAIEEMKAHTSTLRIIGNYVKK